MLITQDEAWRRGATVPLKRTADEAVAASPTVKNVVVLQRTGNDVPMTAGRDHWWHELAVDESACPAEPMDPEDLLYLLYTSGTTAKPKGIAHTTAGYLVGVATTHHYIFDLKRDTDVYWCAADVGWVTGHSYIVYGPLCNGATSVMYEGTPDYPDKDRWWDVAERYGVTILYTNAVATGWALALSCGDQECDDAIKAATSATARCIPLEGEPESGPCIRCGHPSAYGKRVIFGRAY